MKDWDRKDTTREIPRCMDKLFTLGDMYPSDFLKPGEEPRSSKVGLELLLDDQGRVRLAETTPVNLLYGQYWYRSGINSSMRKELQNIVTSITDVVTLGENDLWIDIACNDGTLLSYVPRNLIRVGIDPADDTYKAESEKHADLIIQDYFKADVFKKSRFGNLKAKVITSIAMFYDLERPEEFIRDIGYVLDDDGLWVLQLSYTPLMLQQLAFDNIVHEHLYYYSLFNLKELLEGNGFKVIDCQLNDTNGGSFRVYVMKERVDMNRFSTQPYRDVCEFRVKSLLAYEETLSLDKISTWRRFFKDVEELKNTIIKFIKEKKSEGKTIWGYGASTKGNTLLQYFGLDNKLITAIADRSTYKWGLRTVGTDIPIISEEEMRIAKPDYLLMMPWHFVNSFIEREKEYLKNGGHFIVPCPKVKII